MFIYIWCPEIMLNSFYMSQNHEQIPYVKWSTLHHELLTLIITHINMPKGKPISEDVQWIIVRLGAAFLPEEISMYTNVSECKVRAILTHHKRTRGVDIAKRERPNLYQKLQDEDIKVCSSLFYLPCWFSHTSQHLWTILSSTLDVYLDELCLELEEKHGVSVLASMIWRTLVKGGYSMKKVTSYINWAEYIRLTTTFSSLVWHLNEAWRRGLYLQPGSEHMSPTSLFLLMKVQLIIIQHTEVELGLYVGWRQQEKLSSVEGKGKQKSIINEPTIS